jgi:hypothetical protein
MPTGYTAIEVPWRRSEIAGGLVVNLAAFGSAFYALVATVRDPGKMNSNPGDAVRHSNRTSLPSE